MANITITKDGSSINFRITAGQTVADVIASDIVQGVFYFPDNINFFVNGSPVEASFVLNEGDVLTWEVSSCRKATNSVNVTLTVSGVSVFSNIAFEAESTIADVLEHPLVEAGGAFIPDNFQVTIEGAVVPSQDVGSHTLADYTGSISLTVEAVTCRKAD